MFNIEDLSLKSDAVPLQLRHPATDELLFADEEKKKPVSIYVYGKGSKEYRNAITALQNRQLKRNGKKVSAEVMREEGIEVLVACSEKAINFSYKGQSVNDAVAFRELYSDPKFDWLKEQVDAFVGEVSNFLNQ